MSALGSSLYVGPVSIHCSSGFVFCKQALIFKAAKILYQQIDACELAAPHDAGGFVALTAVSIRLLPI
jgi:hypothetical protein